MNILIGSAVALTMTATQLAAGSLTPPADQARVETQKAEHLWLAKGGNGNDQHKDKARRKGDGNAGKGKPGKVNDKAGKADRRPEHAGGPNPKTNGKGVKAAGGKKDKDRRPFTPAERGEAFTRLISTQAPPDRDMKRLLSAAALGLLTPQVRAAEIDEDELVTYRNCPPGLASKDPPCVPPGLADKGVTYNEWVSHDRQDYDTIWFDRRDQWIDSDAGATPDPGLLLLQSDQIAELFGLDPAPAGRRYGLIDGLPVLLDNKDYNALLLVNQMAQVPDVGAGARIAPTAALTQDELIDLYRLPQLGDNENYSVVNGQIVRLNDSNYELLQMLRIARGVM